MVKAKGGTEKTLSRADQAQASNVSNAGDEELSKTPEPYNCTGQFETDFTEMCRRNGLAVIPPVVPRPHRPTSPSLQSPAHADEKGAKKGDKKGKSSAVVPEPEPVVNELGEPIEPASKTIILRDKYEYFKPCVQVEMDNPDKQDTVSELYIQGWKLDHGMMHILEQCLPKLDRLHIINLWNTGLTEDTLEVLCNFVPKLPGLRLLSLDNNPVENGGVGFSNLLKEESPVQHLSLRYNNITDRAILAMGKLLGDVNMQNQKLLSLNLNGNQCTDEGCKAIAGGLRMNRTLLSLGLSNNKIGDEGAKNLAEVISSFLLTHEEIVERRKLISEKGSPEGNQKSPTPSSRRADSRDRPGSVKSSHGGKAQNKSAKGKGKDKDAKGGKEDDKAKGKGGKEVDKKDKGKGAAPVADMKTPAKGGKQDKVVKAKGGKETGTLLENELDVAEVQNPLMDTVESGPNGEMRLIGNRTLINLNLSSNYIGEEGIKALHSAVGQQTLQWECENHTGSKGLMRLCLNRNSVSASNEHLMKLNELVETKHPFYQPPPSPDQESLAERSAIGTPNY